MMKILHILMLLLSSTAFADGSVQQKRAEREQQWQAEYEREMAQQFPTLQQETILAGITMPAGTKLQLLSKYSVGETAAVKAEYFEKAEFPQTVMWRGLPLKSINRRLSASHCFERHDFNFELCRKLPEKERATQIHWGWYLDTVLAQATEINGFICQEEVNWKRPEILNTDNDDVPLVPADQAAPQFVFDVCIAAKGNKFKSKNEELSFMLPEKSRIFRTRFVGKNLPNGYLDMWTGNDYGGTLSFNLFDLKTENWYLDLKSHDLHEVSGTVVKNTPACPIAPQSYVEWNFREPATLKVYSRKPVKQCGQFKIERLKNPPKQMEFLDLEV